MELGEEGMMGLIDRIKYNDLSWHNHVNGKFRNYEQKWEQAYSSWKAAQARSDDAASLEAFELQGLYLRAEQLAHRDMNIPIEQRAGRWDADYVAEARPMLSKSSDREQRLGAVERIMRTAKAQFSRA